MNLNILRIGLIFIQLLFATNTFAGSSEWAHFAHSPGRTSIAVDGPDKIDTSTLQWIAWEDPTAPGYYIEFQGSGSPVVFKDKVYAYAKVFDSHDNYVNNQMICFDNSTGHTIWHTIIDIAALDSWSSPCVDMKNETIIIGSGNKVFALDVDSGAIAWSTELQKQIVNASVCIAFDITPSRAFITDYDGQGSTGKLYCINLDTNNHNENPYDPGSIVWSATLGCTSGNTPAYKDGVVYVAAVTDPNGPWSGDNPGGSIYAYDATETNAVQLWKTKDSRFEGFFGGVSISKEGFLYAANYDFYSQHDNSALCKIDCNDGSIVWVTQTERTDSIPIVVGDMIYISGGINGFGSRPKLEAFLDMGSSAQKIWETPLSMTIGGWIHQPAYANGKLYVGAVQTGGYFFGSYTDLYILDITKTPQDADFIIDHYSGCGSSPAIIHDSIYTIGADGLHKFYQASLVGDIDRNSAVDDLDLFSMASDWLWDGPVGIKRTDLNLDGFVNFLDYAIMANDFGKTLE